MFRSKRIYCLYLISAFVFILLAQLAFAQELTPAKKRPAPASGPECTGPYARCPAPGLPSG